jgi:hypothetical protein
MSKFTGKKKSKFTPVVAPVTKPVEGEGRSLVAIAKGLKLDPRNARRLARRHSEALGHSSKGDRWLLTSDQEKAFVDLVQAEKASA